MKHSLEKRLADAKPARKSIILNIDGEFLSYLDRVAKAWKVSRNKLIVKALHDVFEWNNKQEEK